MDHNTINKSSDQIAPIIPPPPKKTPTNLIILFGAIAAIILGLLAAIIALAVKKKKKEIKIVEKINNGTEGFNFTEYILSNMGYLEPWYDVFGNKTSNISYAKNGKISNTFKTGGKNYKEDIGNVNDGQDYEENNRTNYDLYIPYGVLKEKDKYHGVFLFIHGGGWLTGEKNEVENFPSRFAKLGYIGACMDYTILSDSYTNFNIYRIMDEISACIDSIVEELKSNGLDENKLEFAIGGVSAGAHLCLLYSYLIEETRLPIKFIVDIVGPISLEPEYWYRLAQNKTPLENIEKETIEEAQKNGTIIKVFEEEDGWIALMNYFSGKKFNENELIGMLDKDKHINETNEKYQEMYKIVKYAFPVVLINSTDRRIPLLCEYCGNDQLVGIAQYHYLKELYEEKNGTIEMVYMIRAGHEQFHYFDPRSIEAMKEMHYKITQFAKKYFNETNS